LRWLFKADRHFSGILDLIEHAGRGLYYVGETNRMVAGFLLKQDHYQDFDWLKD